jgi:pimeloyl-ACP methyl ester carboxylesterase
VFWPAASQQGREPWPLPAWPSVPTRYVRCRNDRLFPAAWVRRVVRDRLGIAPDEIDSGHCPALSQPKSHWPTVWKPTGATDLASGRQPVPIKQQSTVAPILQ